MDFDQYLQNSAEELERIMESFDSNEVLKAIQSLPDDFARTDEDIDRFLSSFLLGKMVGEGKIKNMSNIGGIMRKIQKNILPKFKTTTYSNGTGTKSYL